MDETEKTPVATAFHVTPEEEEILLLCSRIMTTEWLDQRSVFRVDDWSIDV